MHEFERWRSEHFGTTPPLGHCLRLAHRERWLRLHSLPDSKRYAEDEEEYAEVRRRAWSVASELFPTGRPIWLVTGLFADTPDDSLLTNAPHERFIPEAPLMVFEQVGRYEDVSFEGAYIAYVAQTTWPHADFEPLIDAIARDALRAVWFSQGSGEAFAPYDGGIDLILDAPQRVKALRRVFPKLLSLRADGL